MTVKELIEHLSKVDQNKKVFVRRGEWGPCILDDNPLEEAIVKLSKDGYYSWIGYRPDVKEDDDLLLENVIFL